MASKPTRAAPIIWDDGDRAKVLEAGQMIRRDLPELTIMETFQHAQEMALEPARWRTLSTIGKVEAWFNEAALDVAASSDLNKSTDTSMTQTTIEQATPMPTSTPTSAAPRDGRGKPDIVRKRLEAAKEAAKSRGQQFGARKDGGKKVYWEPEDHLLLSVRAADLIESDPVEYDLHKRPVRLLRAAQDVLDPSRRRLPTSVNKDPWFVKMVEEELGKRERRHLEAERDRLDAEIATAQQNEQQAQGETLAQPVAEVQAEPAAAAVHEQQPGMLNGELGQECISGQHVDSVRIAPSEVTAPAPAIKLGLTEVLHPTFRNMLVEFVASIFTEGVALAREQMKHSHATPSGEASVPPSVAQHTHVPTALREPPRPDPGLMRMPADPSKAPRPILHAGNGNGSGPRKHKVLIVGLLGAQEELMKREFGGVFDLRFHLVGHSPQDLKDKVANSDVTIGFVGKMGHGEQYAIKSMIKARAARYIMSPGGMDSLRKVLRDYAADPEAVTVSRRTVANLGASTHH